MRTSERDRDAGHRRREDQPGHGEGDRDAQRDLEFDEVQVGPPKFEPREVENEFDDEAEELAVERGPGRRFVVELVELGQARDAEDDCSDEDAEPEVLAGLLRLGVRELSKCGGDAEGALGLLLPL